MNTASPHYRPVENIRFQNSQDSNHQQFYYSHPEISRGELIIGTERTYVQHIAREWFFVCFSMGTMVLVTIILFFHTLVQRIVLPHLKFSSRTMRMQQQRQKDDDRWDDPSLNLNLDEDDLFFYGDEENENGIDYNYHTNVTDEGSDADDNFISCSSNPSRDEEFGDSDDEDESLSETQDQYQQQRYNSIDTTTATLDEVGDDQCFREDIAVLPSR
jgi:hypothetical protein